MTAAEVASPELWPEGNPKTVTHEDPNVGALLAHYIALLDSSASVLIHGLRQPTDALLTELSSLAVHGLSVSDLSTYQAEQQPTEDCRASSRDYGYIAFGTSGTSGNAKVVLYSKPTLLACAQAIGGALGLSEAQGAVSYVRPNLAYGLSIVHSHYLAQTRVEFRHSPRDPFDLQRDVANLPDGCGVYLLPIQAVQLTYGEFRRPESRALDFRVAGALLPAAVAAKLHDRYPNASLANMYGQSELGPRVSVWRGNVSGYVEGLVGEPLPGVSVRVASAEAEAGQIWVSSPYRMLRYLGQPPPELVNLDCSRLHWLRTGDLGYLNGQGHLVLMGRQSRQLNMGGELIPISAIVSAVRTLEAVGSCSVTPDTHPVLGERALITIVPSSHRLAPDEIVRAVRLRLRQRLGPTAALAHVRVVTSETGEGKL